MKDLKHKEIDQVGGGRDAPQYDAELAPEPASDPLVVIDYNPPQQPQ